MSQVNELKKICISGSAKLQERIDYWIKFFYDNNYNVIDFPRPIEKKKFMKLYPDIHKEYMVNIMRTDILFVMNEDKNDIAGYIGYETFAELAFAVTQKLVYDKDIEIVILKMPSNEVHCFDEIKMWLELGWVKLYNNETGIKTSNI